MLLVLLRSINFCHDFSCTQSPLRGVELEHRKDVDEHNEPNVKSNAVHRCRPLVSFFKESSIIKHMPNFQNAATVLSRLASLLIFSRRHSIQRTLAVRRSAAIIYQMADSFWSWLYLSGFLITFARELRGHNEGKLLKDKN